MNFGKKGLDQLLRSAESHKKKLQTKSLIASFKLFLVLGIFIATVGGFCLFGAVQGILDESPDMGNIDVSPKGLASTIYDANGNEIQTLIGTGANRSLITYEQLPENLINAFIAIEDSRFWTHEGVDVKGVVRAGFIGLSNGLNFTEGASTITQQLIKNNVFEGGSEKTTGARFVRKIQEQYLALELETVMGKEKILENYLNTINLGANCLGVQKAAERYFDKNVEELTLSECAVIAGITQNPYGYNPIRFPENNEKRRNKVLDDMEEQGYITAEEKAEALADNVYERIAQNEKNRTENSEVYTYFVDRLIRDVLRDLEAAGYSSDQATSMLYSGGLHIYTTQDPSIQKIVDAELDNPKNYEGIDQKYSFTMRMTVTHSDDTTTVYGTEDIRKFLEVTYLEFDTLEEIDEAIAEFQASVVMSGDEATVQKDITLQPQLSVVVMDQSTGHVKAIAGGRGEKTASLSLNRATNTFRQPGSTFKVLTSFAPALDVQGATLATTYYDEHYTTDVDGIPYSPTNWYGSNYAGYANIRHGIIYSMNILAVRCLVETVTPDLGYAYAEKFGINTLIPKDETTMLSGKHDARATLALGGITQGVTNMQLTGAYAAIANKGVYTEPILYTKILDNEGNVIIDNTPEAHTVIDATTAFLLTDAMSDSLEYSQLNGLSISASSPEAKPSNIVAAGKSGTTTSYNDLWFVGYTPYYTMGIWSGYDDNAKFDTSDDRDFHKVIWRKIMEQITATLPEVTEFEKPEDIISVRICTKSGRLASKACSADDRHITATEYFVSGTEPTKYCNLHEIYQVCAVSGLMPSPSCTQLKDMATIKLPSNRSGSTQDDKYRYPLGLEDLEKDATGEYIIPADKICTSCQSSSPLLPELPELPELPTLPETESTTPETSTSEQNTTRSQGLLNNLLEIFD